MYGQSKLHQDERSVRSETLLDTVGSFRVSEQWHLRARPAKLYHGLKVHMSGE